MQDTEPGIGATSPLRDLLWAASPVIFVGLVLFATLVGLPQVLDIMRAYALEPRFFASQCVATIIAAGLLSFVLGAVAQKFASTARYQLSHKAICRLTVVAIVTPWAIIGLACVRAGLQIRPTDPSYAIGLRTLVIAGLLIVIAAFLLGCASWTGDRATTLASWFARLPAERFGLLLPLAIAVAMLIIPRSPSALVTAATWVGPLSIIMVAVAIYAACIPCALFLFSQYRRPALAYLLVVLPVGHALGLNDNRAIRVEHTSGTSHRLGLFPSDKTMLAEARAEVLDKDAFVRWLRKRKEQSAADSIPVFIVAAQGGGLYAAAQTAAALARVQDECPTFGQHIFAISGVSGGSVGAAIFASAVAKLQPDVRRLDCRPTSDRSYQTYVEKFVRRDLLSPTLWLMLVPDVVQFLIPFPAVRSYDRALGLEYALEAAGLELGSKGYFDGVMGSSWKPTEATPALFLNTARAGRGEQLYAAPIQMVSIGGTDKRLQSLLNGSDLRTSTAAGLSARFPFVSSTGRLTTRTAQFRPMDKPYTISLVDGGYVENSGLETALLIYSNLRAFQAEPLIDIKFHINLIVIRDQDELILGYPPYGATVQKELRRTAPDVFVDVAESSDYGGTFAPFLALWNSRAYRPLSAQRVVTRILQSYEELAPTSLAAQDRQRFLALDNTNGNIPLTWMLSRLSHDRIAKLRFGRAIPPDRNDCMPPIEVDQLRRYGDTVEAEMDAALLCFTVHDIRRDVSRSAQ
jgi:hypothetical protein